MRVVYVNNNKQGCFVNIKTFYFEQVAFEYYVKEVEEAPKKIAIIKTTKQSSLYMDDTQKKEDEKQTPVWKKKKKRVLLFQQQIIRWSNQGKKEQHGGVCLFLASVVYWLRYFFFHHPTQAANPKAKEINWHGIDESVRLKIAIVLLPGLPPPGACE